MEEGMFHGFEFTATLRQSVSAATRVAITFSETFAYM